MTTNLRAFYLPVLGFLVACGEPVEPEPIQGSATGATAFIGSPAEPRTVNVSIPPHPYMAAQGRSAMHADGYSSDVHPAGGPLGDNTRMNSRVPMSSDSSSLRSSAKQSGNSHCSSGLAWSKPPGFFSNRAR